MKTISTMAVLFLISLSIPVYGKLFNCSTESCFFNGNTSLWTCEYVDCPVMPAWIINTTNITNVTYDIVNCSYTDMVDYLENYSTKVEGNFNFSSQYWECKASRDRCITEMSGLTDLMSSCVPLNQTYWMLNELQNNVTLCQADIAVTNSVSWLRAIGMTAAVIALLWFFKLRKPEVAKTGEVSQPAGETAYNVQALEKDAALAKLESRLAELEVKTKSQPVKPKLPKPKVPKPRPSLEEDVEVVDDEE